MSAITLQSGLSWAASHEEDRRFRWILLQTLLFCLAAGIVMPYVHIPEADIPVDEDQPPRRVRLLAEQPAPVPEPEVKPVPDPPAPVVTAPPKPETVPEQLPVAPVVTPRQKAASSGVLAMSDALAAMQGTTPKTGARTRRIDETARGQTTTPQPSVLTADVTRGSTGIAGGVTHQSVLGASTLPEREASQPGLQSREGRVASTGRTAAPPPGSLRSEDEIQEVLDRHKGAMYTLYNHELRKDPGLQGKLVMSITIAPSGKVTRCVILSSELDSASLERQLVELVKRIDFGHKPGATAVTTKIPIEFFPR